jgi:hypothetical protein
MRRFWEQVVEPVTSALQPRVILHFGARADGVVDRLAGLAKRIGADLHVAVVRPAADLDAVRRMVGDRLIVHRAPGPAVIGLMPAADLAVIDDDPNWFTVHGLLVALRARAEEMRRGFPVVLVGNTGWPFGRRDSYDDPQRIPESFRHPHERAGIMPGQDSLAAGFGLFADRYNAVEANGRRSGVMAAVEDFCAVGEPPRMRVLPGFFGLTVLSPRAGAEAALLAPVLQGLASGEAASALSEQVELARVAAEAACRGLEQAVARERALNEALHEALRARQAAAAKWRDVAARAARLELPAGGVRQLAGRVARRLERALGKPAPDPHLADVARLHASPIFDADWYLAAYEDVRESGVEPAAHYLRDGAREGRDPGPAFSTSYYLEHAPDVAEGGINPLLHYLDDGAREGRNPSALFDTRYYLATYGDVAGAGVNPLEHYLTVGRAEGRQCVPPA